MAATQIQKMSVKHNGIMDYLLANPTDKLGDVARHFGVSQAWLSVIIHSDAFQSQLGERQDELFGSVVVPLREQMVGIAAMGLEKVGEALEHASTITDKDFIVSTTDNVLKNLGYSPKSAPPTQSVAQQNVFIVDKDTLASARDNMRKASDFQKGKLLEHSEDGPTPEEI